MDTYLIAKLISNENTGIVDKEETKVVVMDNKEMKSLKSIDDKMLSIEKQLDDIEK